MGTWLASHQRVTLGRGLTRAVIIVFGYSYKPMLAPEICSTSVQRETCSTLLTLTMGGRHMYSSTFGAFCPVFLPWLHIFCRWTIRNCASWAVVRTGGEVGTRWQSWAPTRVAGCSPCPSRASRLHSPEYSLPVATRDDRRPCHLAVPALIIDGTGLGTMTFLAGFSISKTPK